MQATSVLQVRIYKALNPPVTSLDEIPAVTAFLSESFLEDERGNVLERIFYDEDELPCGREVCSYDSAGRLIRLQELEEGETVPARDHLYRYSESGLMQEEQVSVAGELFRRVYYRYDQQGNLKEQVNQEQGVEVSRIVYAVSPRSFGKCEREEHWLAGEHVKTIRYEWKMVDGEPKLQKETVDDLKDPFASKTTEFFDPLKSSNGVAAKVYNSNGSFLEEKRMRFKDDLPVQSAFYTNERPDAIAYLQENWQYDAFGNVSVYERRENIFVQGSRAQVTQEAQWVEYYKWSEDKRLLFHLQKESNQLVLCAYEYEPVTSPAAEH